MEALKVIQCYLESKCIGILTHVISLKTTWPPYILIVGQSMESLTVGQRDLVCSTNIGTSHFQVDHFVSLPQSRSTDWLYSIEYAKLICYKISSYLLTMYKYCIITYTCTSDMFLTFELFFFLTTISFSGHRQ